MSCGEWGAAQSASGVADKSKKWQITLCPSQMAGDLRRQLSYGKEGGLWAEILKNTTKSLNVPQIPKAIVAEGNV